MKALITGASSGIGRDMAVLLAKQGWDLIVVARREDRLRELAAELPGVEVTCVPADLSDREQCFALYERVKEHHIDLLINNAGFGLCGEFTKLDLDEELRMIDTNIAALHILTKLFLRDFTARDSGCILNVASSAGFMPGPMMATYYATKNYVVRLTEGIHEELRRSKSHVKICALCPGPVDTEFSKVAKVRFSMKGMSSERVAKIAIRGAKRGKLLIIPGIMMKLGKFGGRFISDKAMAAIAYNIQKRKLN